MTPEEVNVRVNHVHDRAQDRSDAMFEGYIRRAHKLGVDSAPPLFDWRGWISFVFTDNTDDVTELSGEEFRRRVTDAWDRALELGPKRDLEI